jgi:hypothetical protein
VLDEGDCQRLHNAVLQGKRRHMACGLGFKE